jgi:hypothetical protein
MISQPLKNRPFYAHLTIPTTADEVSATYHFGPFQSEELGRAAFPIIARGLEDGYLLWIDQEIRVDSRGCDLPMGLGRIDALERGAARPKV